jgi:hypothetical protein
MLLLLIILESKISFDIAYNIKLDKIYAQEWFQKYGKIVLQNVNFINQLNFAT